MDFLVSLGPLTLLTSPSKASSTFSGLISHPRPQDAPLMTQKEKKGRSNVPPGPNPALGRPLSFLASSSKVNSALISHPLPRDVKFNPEQESKGRSGDAPSLQPNSATKKFPPLSFSANQRHPVFKRLPRLTQEEGDESRAISFSVDAPPLAAPPQEKILSTSKGLPTYNYATSHFTLPRPAPIRSEEKKEEDKGEEIKEEEEGRSIPNQPGPAPSHPAPDKRPVRTVYPAAPPPFAPQDKAGPIHLPPSRPYYGKVRQC